MTVKDKRPETAGDEDAENGEQREDCAPSSRQF